MSALTLAGAPSMFRLGSVVRLIRRIDRDVPVGARGVVVQVLADGAFVVAFRWSDDPAAVECEAFAEVRCADIALDLTDATGRAHAAWWLARQPAVSDQRVMGPPTSAYWSRYRNNMWGLADSKGLSSFGLPQVPAPWHAVSALADLDPNDPRLLPDGSRWVDAEALRRVCLHVAGVSS